MAGLAGDGAFASLGAAAGVVVTGLGGLAVVVIGCDNYQSLG